MVIFLELETFILYFSAAVFHVLGGEVKFTKGVINSYRRILPPPGLFLKQKKSSLRNRFDSFSQVPFLNLSASTIYRPCNKTPPFQSLPCGEGGGGGDCQEERIRFSAALQFIECAEN